MFTRMMAQGIVTIIYTLEFAGLLVAALPRYKQKYYVPVKMLCSVSFVVIAVMFAFVSDHMQYFYMMLVPLVLCAVGDLFMGLYQIRSRRKHMLAGMIVFLLAHMGFLICFFRIDARLTWWNIFLPVVSLAAFFFVKRLMHLHMEDWRFRQRYIASFCRSCYPRAHNIWHSARDLLPAGSALEVSPFLSPILRSSFCTFTSSVSRKIVARSTI